MPESIGCWWQQPRQSSEWCGVWQSAARASRASCQEETICQRPWAQQKEPSSSRAWAGSVQRQGQASSSAEDTQKRARRMKSSCGMGGVCGRETGSSSSLSAWKTFLGGFAAAFELELLVLSLEKRGIFSLRKVIGFFKDTFKIGRLAVQFLFKIE